MAIVVSMYSLVIRRSAIEERYPGGWEGFVAAYPRRNAFRADSEIVRFGAMGPYLGPIREDMEKHGIRLHRPDQPGDMAVEPLREVPWLEVGSLKTVGGLHCIACRLAGSKDSSVVMHSDPMPEEEIAPDTQWVPWEGPKWERVHADLDGEVFVG